MATCATLFPLPRIPSNPLACISVMSFMNECENNRSTANDISLLGMEKPDGGLPIEDEPLSPSDSRSEIDGDSANKSLILRDLIPTKRSTVVDHRHIRDYKKGMVSSCELNVSEGVRVPHGLVQNWMQGFDIGDMVWGKVKSHPWWPGQIFNEIFASPEVRRSKKEGHFLVAFFGDNSYGWFHPMELIPFDPLFAEKSKQTVMKNFEMAVHEAVDEIRRRAALGFTCYCLNKFNFRPTRVLGYFHVDVPSYEPGAIYSSNQINDARNKFEPRNLLSFAKQAALNPLMSEFPDLDRIKNIASGLAYRKAVFEEFDETYAQAFGVEPVRPSPDYISILDQLEIFPQETPLSGQLVVPESQGLGKTSKLIAAGVAKVRSPENTYVRKRRNEPRGGPGLAGSSSSSSKQLTIAAGGTSPSGKKVPVSSQANRSPLYKRPSLVPGAEGQRPVWEVRKAIASSNALQKLELGGAGSAVARCHAPDNQKLLKGDSRMLEEDNVTGGLNYLSILSGLPEGLADSKGGVRVEPVLSYGREETPKAEAGTVKKVTVRKNRVEDVGVAVGSGETGKDKKNNKKKVTRTGSDFADNKKGAITSADQRGKLAGKSIIEASEPQESTGGAVKPDEAEIDVASRNVDLRLVVSDIQELAANHSYGSERNAADTALGVVRRYRSHVYKKGQVVPPPSTELGASESSSEPSAVRKLQESVANRARIAALSKASAADQLKPDDSTKAGRKRSLPEQQAETSTKRLKKMHKLKPLPVEKKAGRRVKAAAIVTKGLQRNRKGKEISSAAVSPLKGKLAIVREIEEAGKKQEQQLTPPPKTPSPTLLIMKFPPSSMLPSVVSLKARFARFGPLDQSAIRVFWKSYTCKVVFKFKPDAERAFNYVKGHNPFGRKVICYLRELDEQGSDPPSTSKLAGQVSGSRPAMDGLQVMSPGEGAAGAIVPFVPSSPQLSLPPNGQLKSILKKPSGDGGQRSNSGPVGEALRGITFLTGGEDETKAAGKTDGRANGDDASSHSPSPRPPHNSRDPRLFRRIPPAPMKTVFSCPPPIIPPPMPNSQHLLPPFPAGPPPSFTFLMPSRPQLPVPLPQLMPPPPPRTLVQPPVLVPLLMSPPPPRTLDQPSVPVPVPQLMPPPPPRALVQPPTPVSRAPPQPRTPDVPRSRNRDPRLARLNQAAESSKKELPDISEELMDLLFQCKDVVNNVRDAFGYLPYHPI